jgi:stage II sporulation protein GA (sporulation sigma-E factor processing peptidase)
MHIKEFFKVYVVCTGVAMLIGGATFSAWYMLGYTTAINSINVMGLIGIGALIGSIVYFSFDKIRKRLVLPAFEYDITIRHANKKVYIKSILDTGNCLYTSLDHKPVIVVTYEAIKELFTDEQEIVINQYKNDILQLLCQDVFKPSYIIPFNSVGCKAGILLGIEVDQVSLHKNSFEKNVEKCVVGVAFNNIFRDQAYTALLHPDFILN